MIFVPPVQSVASPAALDLGQRLANVVQEYRQTHPGTSGEDVRQAFRVAAQVNAGGAGRRSIALGIALAAAVIALLMPLVMGRATGRPIAGPWLPILMIGLIAVLFAVVRVARR
jgi:hypothetical protein